MNANTKQPENPPAFPIPLHSSNCPCPCGNEGMTLRDYFAGQAMAGELASHGKIYSTVESRLLSEQCYRYADAMLDERLK